MDKYFAFTVDLFTRDQTIYIGNANTMEIYGKFPLADLAYTMLDKCYEEEIYVLKLVGSSSYMRYFKVCMLELNEEVPENKRKEITIEIYEV